MLQVCYCGPPRGLGKRAFTLIEIIIALTIVAVIAAVAVPTLKGLNEDEKTRAPLSGLADLVQEVRSRAMREHRPYEIIFEREGVHAIPGNRSFIDRDEFLKFLEELRTPPLISTIARETIVSASIQSSPPPTGKKLTPPTPPAAMAPSVDSAPELPWTRSIAMDNGLKCEVLMWGDGEWDVMEGERMRRWVFQVTGMASPTRVRFATNGTELEAGFDMLTGEMTGEQSRPSKVIR